MKKPEEDARRAAGDEALRAIAPMLRELRAVLHLSAADPRRAAAIAEKERVLELIAIADPRLALPGRDSAVFA